MQVIRYEMEKEKKISTKDMVVNVLKEDPFFKDFKFNRTESTLIKYTEWGFFGLSVQSRMYVPGVSEFRLCAIVHYRIITDWFLKYSYSKEISDIMYYSNIYEPIIFDETKVDYNFGEYYVHREPELFARDVEELKRKTIIQADRILKKFDNIDNYYEYEVKPYIEGEKELVPTCSWMATTLAATKIVSPENYEKYKQIYREDWKNKLENGYKGYDVKYYFPKLDEIYAYLDSINLKDQVIKRRGEKEITDAVFARKPKESEGKFSWLLSFANKLKN